MRKSFVPIIAVMALLAVSCGNSEKLEGELASANARVQELDSMLTDTQSQLQTEREQLKGQIQECGEQLAAAENKRDKLVASLSASQGEAKKLRSDLSQARAEYAQARDSLNEVIATAQIQLERNQRDLKDALARLDASEMHANDLMQTRDSLYALVDDVQPWFSYYKHESRRNWLKKLFGAGNAKKPESPEPSFESTAAPADLEVHR